MIVYRFAQWYPNLVSHVFSVCTPFSPPSDTYVPTEALVKSVLPQFGYQLHLAGPEVEANIQSRERIAKFLSGMFGGRDENKRVVFDPFTGVDFNVIDGIGAPLLLSGEVRIL